MDLGRIVRFLLALACLAEPLRATAPRVLLTPFIIYTSFANPPTDAIRSTIEAEINSIIEPIGWKPEWITLDDSHPLGSASLAIVRFKGSCDVEDLSRYPYYQELVLGRTYTVNGAIIPITDVFCSSIRAKLAESLIETDVKRRELVYGRAVARVVAHELYHILAREKRHASGGIAEGRFTSEELIADRFQFRPDAVRKLRRSLVPVLLAAYGWIGRKGGQPGPRVFISSGCSGCHGLLGEGTAWGPRLRLDGKDWNQAQLVFRLADPGTEMYRRASHMNLLWPSLRPDEARALFDYVSSLPPESGFVAAY